MHASCVLLNPAFRFALKGFCALRFGFALGLSRFASARPMVVATLPPGPAICPSMGRDHLSMGAIILKSSKNKGGEYQNQLHSLASRPGDRTIL